MRIAKVVVIILIILVALYMLYFGYKVYKYKQISINSQAGPPAKALDPYAGLTYGEYVKATGLDYIAGTPADSTLRPYCKGGKVFINGYPQNKSC